MKRSRRSVSAGVTEEIRHHIELMIEENLARGMGPELARADAVRRFGDVKDIQEACELEDLMAERKVSRGDRFAGWRDDLRYGVRVLARSPIYALVVVVTLAFGIGAIAFVFSALSPYFLRALPFDDAHRLVHLFTVNPAEGWDKDRFSLPQYADVRERTRAFEDVAAYYYGASNLADDAAAEQITVGHLTANAFDVLGARPHLGRTFRTGEDGAAGADLVVLGYGLWQRRYAADPSIVGTMVRLNGVPHRVIGVMAKDFNFPFGGVKAWVPIREDVVTDARDRTQFLVFGRLAADWSPERARADLQSVWNRLGSEYPDVDGRRSGINVLGMRPALNFAWDVLRIAFIALTGAVAFVLLIACANLTGLGLARASSRRREVAVRAALGAPRHRLLRQFLVESAILASVGGGSGLLLAYAFMGAAAPLFPEDLYAVGTFGIDGLTLLVTAAVTTVTALLIGSAPALSVTGVLPGDALREGGRSGAAGRRTARLRSALVIAELALGMVLGAGAGLMVRSLARVSEVPLGFDPDRLLGVELSVPENEYPDAASYEAYFQRVVEAVETLPGSTIAATAAYLPLNHENPSTSVRIPGQPIADETPSAERFAVSAGYFETMRIGVVAGRVFESQDDSDAATVAVINREFVHRHFGGSDPLGATALVGDARRALRIIGVVDDVQHSSIMSPPPPQIYVAISQFPVRRRFLVTRTSADVPTFAASLRAAITAVDPDVPANRLRPMSAILDESVGPFAVMSIVLGAFSAFALLLAAIGLYGLIAYSVAQRKTEFGVRMALGAGPRELLRVVLGEGARLALVGIVLGLVAALASGQLLASLLYGVRPTDPVTQLSAALVFLFTAVVATFIPAVRATRLNPLVALRAE